MGKGLLLKSWLFPNIIVFLPGVGLSLSCWLSTSLNREVELTVPVTFLTNYRFVSLLACERCQERCHVVA